MQDPRLKVMSMLLLSTAAFIHPVGAIAVIGWWLVFTKRRDSLPPKGVMGGLAIMIVVIGVLNHFGGGDGFSYIIRMTAILLICGWTYTEWRSGEMLDVLVWLLGERWGFELGIVAEMAMQTLHLVEHDYRRIRRALHLKGLPWGLKSGIVCAMNLTHDLLQRSEEQAKLLAVRGYRHGGTHSPVFIRNARDSIAATVAFYITLGIIVRFVIFL